MINLGIFGDSFADDTNTNNSESWIDVIRKTEKYKIINYARAGSSFWYSYKQFIEHNQKYEKNIVLVTTPHRLVIPEDSNIDVPKFINYQQVLERFYSLNDNQESLKKDYELIKNYYEKIHNWEQDESLHALMLKEIINLRPDTIVYYSIPPSKDIFSLFHVVMFECAALNIDILLRDKWTYTSNMLTKLHQQGRRDSRKCHMTEENNQVVGEMFVKKLEGRTAEITESDLKRPSKPIDFYFTLT